MTKSANRGVATSKTKATMVVLEPVKAGGKKKKRKPQKISMGNPISVNFQAGNRNPSTHSDKTGTIVTHSETYGINVTGTSSFGVFSQWAVQPGISIYSNGSPLGQWLPQIGNNFDNYEIKHLKFVYRSSCSTLEPGLVAFGYEPNPVGSVPGSLQELRNMKSVMGTVHKDLSFDVSNLARGARLTRKGAVVGYPSYDAGKVFFATNGCTELAKLGFIEVYYTVRFFNPQSSTSTTVPNITYDPVQPVWRIIYSPTSNSGNANAAVNCFDPFGSVILSATSEQGAPLFQRLNASIPALSLTYGGNVFQNNASTGSVMRCLLGGRFRLKAALNGNFEDLKLFAMAPFRKSATASTYELCTTLVSDSTLGSSLMEMTVMPVSHRGFTGVALSDPNPGTDLECRGEWDVTLDSGDSLLIGVGVRTYNSVSTTTANFQYVTGTGFCSVELAYLGPAS